MIYLYWHFGSKEYPSNLTKDPRIRFVEQLVVDGHSNGDELVYNIGFEVGKIERFSNENIEHKSHSKRLNWIT